MWECLSCNHQFEEFEYEETVLNPAYVAKCPCCSKSTLEGAFRPVVYVEDLEIR